jgi:hypothetical protein
MASTAPLISSVFFANPEAVYGLAAAGALVAGRAEGGLTSLAPVEGGVVCYDDDGILTCTPDPEVGNLTAVSLTCTTGHVTLDTGNLTVTAGTLTVVNGVVAGSLETTGTTSLGGSLTVTGATTLSATPPTEPRHAATKGYVDSVASGLRVRGAVQARTTEALPAYSALDGILTATRDGLLTGSTFDEVTPTLNMRVLVADEPSGPSDLRVYNGIYTVTSLGSTDAKWVLTRAADADSSEELRSGTFVFVTGGSTYKGDGFVLTTPTGADPTLGTTSLVFSQFSEAGAVAPGGSANGQVQLKNGSEFSGTAAFSYTETSGVVVNGAPFTVLATPLAEGETQSLGAARLQVGATGIIIEGIETTISAETGGISTVPGIVVSYESVSIYGDGNASGKPSLVADDDGISITGPIQLRAPTSADYVTVGAISAQAEGQAGAAVAFGAGAGVTARRGIALGMGAVARVADAAVIPALSLSQRVGSASAALGRSGLAAYAAGMTFLPSGPLNLKVAYTNNTDTPDSYSTYTVPAGMMFIPLGAVIWLHARDFAGVGVIAASPTLAATLANAGGRVILPATALAITRDSPVGLAVGATPSDLTAVAAGGVIFYRVAAATTDESIASATARVALYGLCVELES